jgi:uncharacterized membrane protein YdbT with pleckstrin-like domain
LPNDIRVAQQQFDEETATVLDGIADRIEGNGAKVRESLQDSLERLEKITLTCCAGSSGGALATHLQTVLPLYGRIAELTTALDREI